MHAEAARPGRAEVVEVKVVWSTRSVCAFGTTTNTIKYIQKRWLVDHRCTWSRCHARSDEKMSTESNREHHFARWHHAHSKGGVDSHLKTVVFSLRFSILWASVSELA